MQIDWFTFGAQIANFLLLVWLLRRFLYGPITAAMSERQQRIADRFEEAREKQETAEAEAKQYRHKLEELAATRDEKIEKAEKAARERRREMVEEARAEVDRLEGQWKEALRRERETFLKELGERVSHETVELARRALRDLAHADLEKEVVRVFRERLRALDDDRRQLLTDAVQADDGTVRVHTVFELGDENKRGLTETLREVTGTEVTMDVDREAELGLGIELRAGGHKVAWSLQSYFAEVEEQIRERIDAELSRGEVSPVGEGQEHRTAVASASAGTDNLD
jgi:F-type H+-transporting ATPase subunit b